LRDELIAAAPVPPSVESMLENWTPSDQQAFAKFRDKHFPGEMSSYAIQSLGSAWKDGQANSAPAAEKICRDDGRCEYAVQIGAEVEGHCPDGKCAMPQTAAHLTIPGALEWGQLPGPVEIEYPEFSEQGMGCGLEDRGITDRYEAMRYGYDEALDQFARILDGYGPLYTRADTHGVVGTHGADGESAYGDAKEACAEVERTGAPGDVIREMNDELVDIRAERDDYKSRWLAGCEALKLIGIHARHAEKLVKSCREKLEVDSVGKGFIEALDGFIGALGSDDGTHCESVEAKSACSRCGDWGHIETEDSARDCPECGPSVIERAVEAGVMNAPAEKDPFAAAAEQPYVPLTDAEIEAFESMGSGNRAKRRIAAIAAAKQKTCIECDQPYCHGVCVERGDQDYDRDQAAKGGDQ
jgi:predicted RNA-binding Zn-ribbon protein involved in translation (DUF1610 family)